MNIVPRKPYRILTGDVREKLAELPDESVHCVVTSPPYWSLRDYGIEGQLGLEPTIDLYVQHMVEVFRDVRRVLRKDRTFWLNMGDCYAAGTMSGKAGPNSTVRAIGQRDTILPARKPPHGLKPKDLVGQPWRVSFALQADGWYLRSDIIWAKTNPMPESCTDRPTKSHEYVFLLTKAAKYFFDQEAVREDNAPGGKDRIESSPGTGSGMSIGTGGKREARLASVGTVANGRNIRSVWQIPTQPFPEAHFATFPEALPERCIKAGTSERGCCPKCGAPWVRVIKIDKTNRPKLECGNMDHRGVTRTTAGLASASKYGIVKRSINGWEPSCSCQAADPVPCTVLDPFVGSGTTALVAIRLGRRAVGIDLSAKYTDMVEKQLAVAACGGSRRPRKFRLKGRKKIRRRRDQGT